MSQLHILVVVDSDTGEFHIAGMEEAPVDSAESVWDPDTDEGGEWRPMTEVEQSQLADAEARLHALIHPEETK